MTEFRLYRGLPASGKTTLARAWVAEDPAHRARSNRDDLRVSLHDGVYLGQETEHQIRTAQEAAITALLRAGVSVACDDTNLPQRRARDLATIALQAGASVDVVDLTDVPLEVCIGRDAGRENGVGDEVIIGMHRRYLAGAPYPLPLPFPEALPALPAYEPAPGTPLAIMVDLDGTLCLHNGRDPYDESRIGEDLPNAAVVKVIENWLSAGNRVLFCSGRSEDCRAGTEAWLDEHLDRTNWFPRYGTSASLFMRPAGDKRKDAVVKLELFDKHIRGQFNVVFVLDDRQRVVDAWRSIGLTVFQVAPGAF